MLQGDVHRFYRDLRGRWPSPPGGAIPDLDHVREISEYYARISPAERQLLLAWAMKEEAGIGLIPVALSGIPLISLIFAPLIQGAMIRFAPRLWITLWALTALGMITGVWVHQRQRAFTTLHLTLLRYHCQKDEGPTPG